MAVFSNLPAVSNTLTFGTALTSVTSGGYSVTSNTVDNSTGTLYLNGILRLTFSTPLTAGTGAPYIALYPQTFLDGTNVQNPPGTGAVAPRPNATGVYAQVVASTAFSVIDFGDPGQGFPLGPFVYGFQFFNTSGVAWSGGGTITATLYRWNLQGV